MSKSWTTPNLGDIILLSQGFENFDSNSGSHYGLVVGLFKVKDNHTINLMVASGTSIKSKYSINSNTDLIILKSSGLVGKDTKFYFLLIIFISMNFLLRTLKKVIVLINNLLQ